MNYCTKCKTEIPDDKKHCGECAFPIGWEKLEKKCTCKSELFKEEQRKESLKTCMRCGGEL